MNIRSYLNGSIVRKVIFYLILMSTIISIFTSGFQIFSEYQRDMTEIHTGLNQIKKTHIHNIVSRLWVLDLEELDIILKGLLDLPSVSYIAVYDDKNILLSEGENIVENFISKQYPLIYKDGTNDIVLGELMVKASLDNVQQNIIERALLIIVGNIIKTLLIVLLLLLIFYHILAKHLVKIALYTDSLNIDNLEGSFDFDRKPHVHSDELDLLRNSILKMQSQLFVSTTSLKAREKEQFEILDSMLDAVISIDEKGEILTFNRAATTLFAYKSDEVIGQNVKMLMPNDIADKHDSYLENYNANNISRVVGLGRDVTGMRKNNTLVPLRLFVAKLPRDIKGRKRFIGTLVDLTDFKNQQEQLKRSQKMEALGKLTGGIAHDFNNLLSIIMGYTDLIESTVVNQPILTKYTKQIKYASDRGAELTNKLLSFSKVNTDNFREHDINQLLRSQNDMLNKIIAVTIDLKITLDEKLWKVYIDGSDLEDTIINLCINSIHAMQTRENGACLQITTSNQSLNNERSESLNIPEGDYVNLTIKDNGIGMDEKTRELIFDPFYTTKGSQGTGLGLAQVFGFIKRSKGAISVKSEMNKGTVFNLYIPRYFTESVSNEYRAEVKNKVLGGNESILVVDDEKSLGQVTKEFLVLQGYSVSCVENGQQALDILSKKPFDLVVTDVVMPEMDGYQLASKLSEKYPDIKILLVSGYSDKRQLSVADKELHKNILKKPFEYKELYQRIRVLLDSQLAEGQYGNDMIIKEGKRIKHILWDEKYSLQVAEIDEDHKDLLEDINKCIDVVNGDENSTELGQILKNLLSEGEMHFSQEETLLANNQYPYLTKHILVHRIYIDGIKKYTHEFNQQNLSADTLLSFLVDWFKEHVLGMDRASMMYITKKSEMDDGQ